MSSIEQREGGAGGVAALPSTLEIFDKFKPVSGSTKDSDSEESFHLVLDDDDVENQSVVSNGRDKEIQNEETEDDILNKFETLPSGTPDQMDSLAEDIILNEDDYPGQENKSKTGESSGQGNKKWSNTEIKITYDFGDYEDSGDGEFKSIYETDAEASSEKLDMISEPMEVTEEQNVVSEAKENSVDSLDNFEDCMDVEQDDTNQNIANIIETLEDQDTSMVDNETVDKQLTDTVTEVNMDETANKCNVAESNGKENLQKDVALIGDGDVEMSEEGNQEQPNENDKTTASSDTFQDVTKKSQDSQEVRSGEDEVSIPISQETTGPSEHEDNKNNVTEQVEEPQEDREAIQASEERTASNSSVLKIDSTEISSEQNQDSEAADECKEVKSKSEKESNEEEAFFKVPEEVPRESEEEPSTKEEKEGPDLSNEKSNDKTDDDEGDLLDISMVRETDEDDACAIADAIKDSTAMDETDKETQASEKSDEEQSERVETEQEGSDIDKDRESNEDNDTTMGFDDLDDDSRMDGDESLNAERPEVAKSKVTKMSESSKDSGSDSDLKQATDSSNEETKKLEETSSDGDGAKIDELQSQTDEEKPENIAIDKIESSDTAKTDEDSDTSKESSSGPVEPSDEAANEEISEESTDRRKSSFNKRSRSVSETEGVEVSPKKAKLGTEIENQHDTSEKPADASSKLIENSSADESSPAIDKVKTLTSFSKFMQCRKLTARLSRTDLEQFCIQKICESLMLKSTEGELHQTIKKHEKTIDNLRKDLQQLTKQCKDLEIVNRKLMGELKSPNVLKKPLVPLKITRSVGLQVRLNPGNEVANQNRRRQPMTNTPQKQMTTANSPVVNRGKANPGNIPSNVVRQVMQTSPLKSPLTAGQTTTNNPTAPMLSQALQKRPMVAKRTATPARKSVDVSKSSHPGVIDLTDEDDRLAQAKSPAIGNTIKIINKTVTAGGTLNKAMTVNKMSSGGKTLGKQVSKAVAVGSTKGNLSPGIRLTPASVITSTSNGSPQMVYVVPTITSNSGGQQKVAFVNFQPTNGVLSGTLNGSTVSVMSNKPGQTLTLKTVSSPLRPKHPAPLPTPPRINLDPKLKPLLPKPLLTIKKIDTGIILQWKMPYNLDVYENIASYQLYAYQETSAPPSTDMWRKVGDVKALALPMACTLTQFADKNKYYFAVRSVDVHKRIGAFSDPEEISL